MIIYQTYPDGLPSIWTGFLSNFSNIIHVIKNYINMLNKLKPTYSKLPNVNYPISSA